MKLEHVKFSFSKGFVTWNRRDDLPFYTGDNVSKYKGKRYKWKVTAVYGGYEYSWNSFETPSAASALRYLQSVKKGIKELNTKTSN